MATRAETPRPSVTPLDGLSPHHQLRCMVEAYLISQTIGTAARLAVADELSTGPRTTSDLAATVGAPEPVFRRFLRACAAAGLLSEDEPDRFGLTPLGECLRTDAPGSLRNFAISYTGPGFWLPSGQLADAVRTGRSVAEQTLGMPLWEYYRENAEEGAYFAAGMSEYSALVLGEILDHYDVSRFERIIDVGGSKGDFLIAMLNAAPSATGLLFDLPEAVERARDVLGHSEVADRAEVCGGSFLDEIPSGGDLYTLKGVLCDWDDESVVRILRNCHRAAEPGTRLLVVDRIVPPEGQPSALYIGDMFTLAVCGGGLRSQADFEALITKSGYEPESVITTPGSATLLVAVRP